MSFIREKTEDFYLLTTDVENIFINEYMPAAPGDYVKVYLYGLMYSLNQSGMTYREMAKQLNLTEKDISDAWEYWNRMGIVRKIPKGPSVFADYDIEFIQLRRLMYGGNAAGRSSEKQDETQRADNPLYDETLRDLLFEVEDTLGKTLSASDTEKIFSWVKEIGATRAVITAAVSYCFEKGKTGIPYMTKVIEQWTEDGLKTEEDVAARFGAIEQRLACYKEVFRTLGLNRGVTAAERSIMDKWFDEMGFDMDRVLDACCKGSFIPNPNIRYVNGILEKWYEEAKAGGRNVNSKITVTQAVLNKYYEYLRHSAEEAAAKRREQVYSKLPRVEEIDEELFALGKRMSKSILGGDLKARNEVKRLMNLLEEERCVLLTENDFEEDYTDIKYSCSKCSDTGITEDGTRCDCTKERIGEAELWQNSCSAKI